MLRLKPRKPSRPDRPDFTQTGSIENVSSLELLLMRFICSQLFPFLWCYSFHNLNTSNQQSDTVLVRFYRSLDSICCFSWSDKRMAWVACAQLHPAWRSSLQRRLYMIQLVRNASRKIIIAIQTQGDKNCAYLSYHPWTACTGGKCTSVPCGIL